MIRRAVPMLHVPDVLATAQWYGLIGFVVRDTGDDGAGATWSLLQFGESELMLNSGGKPSQAYRREVDLYLHVEDVQAMFNEIGRRAEVITPPHDTFYGMREFIIRDPNRFWLTFGQPAG